MGRITDGNIIAQGETGVEVSFSGTDCFSYVNGLQVAGPNDGTALLPFGADDVFAVEIHDLQIQESTPNNAKRPVHPVIIFSAVSGAVQYRIYHTAPGSDEVLAQIQIPEAGRKAYKVRMDDEATKGWNFYRVEAVDSGGNETTRTVWPELVYDLPDAPTSVALAGSGGTFSLTAS